MVSPLVKPIQSEPSLFVRFSFIVDRSSVNSLLSDYNIPRDRFNSHSFIPPSTMYLVGWCRSIGVRLEFDSSDSCLLYTYYTSRYAFVLFVLDHSVLNYLVHASQHLKIIEYYLLPTSFYAVIWWDTLSLRTFFKVLRLYQVCSPFHPLLGYTDTSL